MGNEETTSTRSDEPKEVSGLVIVGSSAGGIDAVLTLVRSLPASFPVPVIIAQHLDPHRPSLLPELLASRSLLPVRAPSGDEPLRPGTVYVVPVDRDVEISEHHIGFHRDSAGLSQPSVDRVMTSAARVFGDMLTGVILTGTGSDGAAGAQAIKAHGGTVIIQNPRSAKYGEMPGAVPPAVVDVVAELETIGSILVDLYSGSGTQPPTGDDGEFRAFLDRIHEQTGIDFTAYKRPTIERRMQRWMVAAGTTTLAEYDRYVSRHPEEIDRLAANFLIKVTHFFWDPELFTHLRNDVLPGMIDEEDWMSQVIERDFVAQAEDKRAHEPTMYTCPDCGGVLWQVETGAHGRFRCHVGHAYAPEALLDQKSEELEAALWSCVRLLREKATLTRQTAARSLAGGQHDIAARSEETAQLNEDHARAIRELLESMPSPNDPALSLLTTLDRVDRVASETG